MSTITREFTKDQLIARINQVTAINKYRISRDPDADGLAMDNELLAIAMASLESEPVSNRDELPDVELETNESDRHWYLVSWCAKGGYVGFTDIYLSSPWANGSARKVAEIISELNMVTDLVITSVFPMPAAPQQEVK